VSPYTIDRHQPARHESSKVKSPCHIPTFPSQLTAELSLSTQCAVHRPRPCTGPILLDYGHPSSHDHGLQSVSPNSLDQSLQVYVQTRPLRHRSSHGYGLQVYLQPHSITPSKSVQSWPPRVSPNSLNPGFQVYFQTRSLTASKFARSRPPSASPNPLDHDCGVHLYVHSIRSSKCISNYARLLHAHLQSHSIMASECISGLTRLSFSDAPRIALKHRLQPVQIYHV